MLNLILIVLLIISLSKPDILIAKKYREKANDEQKAILAKNLRKSYVVFICATETLGITRYFGYLGVIPLVISVVLFFALSVRAGIKENRKIVKELKNQIETQQSV